MHNDDRDRYRVGPAIASFLGALLGTITFTAIRKLLTPFNDFLTLTKIVHVKSITLSRCATWLIIAAVTITGTIKIGSITMVVFAKIAYSGDPFHHEGYLALWASSSFILFLICVHVATSRIGTISH